MAAPFPLSDRASDVRPGCKTQRIAPTPRQVADLVCVRIKEREYFKTCIVGHVNCCLQCAPTLRLTLKVLGRVRTQRCDIKVPARIKTLTRDIKDPRRMTTRNIKDSKRVGTLTIKMKFPCRVRALRRNIKVLGLNSKMRHKVRRTD
ncbi:hypothetical protein PoB_002208200 [Plakobranchus ocellatus]|uniref:Uncharacterized protein n=1 Tax=Plakobranchus ocellatus TaxID=259542 RepID=A0AAV3ZLQ2_9GAST|nr:hypothetical protein PoB_002208200 [Plakobranchus ocellatus]